MCSWTLPCTSSPVPSVLHLSHGFEVWRKPATDKLVEKFVKNDSWPIQPDILSPPLLQLTSRKPLWLDFQPVDLKSQWRHNWKSAQMVNSHLVCDPTIRQPGFNLPWQQWSLLNRFRTKQGHCGACRRKSRTYRHWSVSLWRDPDNILHCQILSWRNWMAAYLGYTLRMKTVFRGWPGMVHDIDMHTRRSENHPKFCTQQQILNWMNIMWLKM